MVINSAYWVWSGLEYYYRANGESINEKENADPTVVNGGPVETCAIAKLC